MILDDPTLYMRIFGNTTVALGVESTLGIVDDIEELAQINDAGASTVLEQLTVTIVTGSLRTVEVRERYRTQDGHITQLVCREVGV
jgi:chemotaxis protein CheY-P-specific phosphatase CheC